MLDLVENSLWARPPGCSGGRVGKGRRACNYVSEIWIPPPIPLWLPRRLNCQISANQRKAEMSINVNKHFKTCAKGKDVITNIISTNQHFASTFLMQLFKFQRRSCKLSFLSLPCCQSVLESLLTGYVNKHVANTKNARIILTHASHFLVHFLRWMEDMTTWREIFLPLLDLACHP